MADEFRGETTVVNAVSPAVIQTDILEQCSRKNVYYMVFGTPMKTRDNVLIMVSARQIIGLWLCGSRIENVGSF